MQTLDPYHNTAEPISRKRQRGLQLSLKATGDDRSSTITPKNGLIDVSKAGSLTRRLQTAKGARQIKIQTGMPTSTKATSNYKPLGGSEQGFNQNPIQKNNFLGGRIKSAARYLNKNEDLERVNAKQHAETAG